MSTQDPVLYYAPYSRATGAAALLEELAVPYDLNVLNLRAGDGRQPDYLAVNPLGKVPTLTHNGAVITEQVAIYLYLADRFPEAGLAPALEDPLRGPYLRWMVYYAASFEPAIVDRAMQREPGDRATVPYGDFDLMLTTLFRQLEQGPYALGDRFTTADVLWGNALNYCQHFGLYETPTVIQDYIARVTDRPSFARVMAMDERLAAEQAESERNELLGPLSHV